MAKQKNQGGAQQAKGGKSKGKGGGKKGKKDSGPAPTYKRETLPRMRLKSENEIAGKLKEEFGFKNVMQIPRLVKISLNMGSG